ncbi:MAG: hypothetical protein GX222_01905 [Ruminococcaceae bacterium]|nr:hypothetical protein [Oscillospiraceae bacterium]
MNESSKSRYFLAELLMNCLLFAVSAAVCVAVLAHANIAGKKSAALSMAVSEAQNVAESVKASKGEPQLLGTLLDTKESDGVYTLLYDENWQRLFDGSDAVYELRAVVNIDDNMLQSDISVADGEGAIYTLRVLRYLGAEKGESV